MNYASIKLKRDFTDTVVVGMAMHVEALIKDQWTKLLYRMKR